MANINPIFLAKNNCSVINYKRFVIPKTDPGYSHYRAMTKKDSPYWKAQAWFIMHCVDCLGMKLEDFQEPKKAEILKSLNLKKSKNERA
jgi:hypothetical protein